MYRYNGKSYLASGCSDSTIQVRNLDKITLVETLTKNAGDDSYKVENEAHDDNPINLLAVIDMMISISLLVEMIME